MKRKDENIAEPLLVTIGEATRLTGMSRSVIYRRLARGELTARKSGTRTLIEMPSLRRCLGDLPSASFGARA